MFKQAKAAVDPLFISLSVAHGGHNPAYPCANGLVNTENSQFTS